MRWNDLEVLVAVAAAGSLSGAASALGVNHSTVFRRLNALERDLSARLFDRLPTGYLLTPTGERCLELARQAEEIIVSIEREIAGRDLEPSGVVRLTTAPNLARLVVPGAIAALRVSHPQILVEVSVGDSDYDLTRREADLALRATTQPPEHLIGQRLGELPWWVCSLRRKRSGLPQDPAGLSESSLIGADRALMRLGVFQWLESNYKEQIVARANDLSTMAALARAGVGLALLPHDQDEHGLRRLFQVPGIASELWLLTHPDLRPVRRIRTVWEAISEAVRQANIRDY